MTHPASMRSVLLLALAALARRGLPGLQGRAAPTGPGTSRGGADGRPGRRAADHLQPRQAALRGRRQGVRGAEEGARPSTTRRSSASSRPRWTRTRTSPRPTTTWASSPSARARRRRRARHYKARAREEAHAAPGRREPRGDRAERRATSPARWRSTRTSSQRYPDDAGSRARLAEIYRQTGDHDKAMEFARAALHARARSPSPPTR